jgi:hypothetical protein
MSYVLHSVRVLAISYLFIESWETSQDYGEEMDKLNDQR